MKRKSKEQIAADARLDVKQAEAAIRENQALLDGAVKGRGANGDLDRVRHDNWIASLITTIQMWVKNKAVAMRKLAKHTTSNSGR